MVIGGQNNIILTNWKLWGNPSVTDALWASAPPPLSGEACWCGWGAFAYPYLMIMPPLKGEGDRRHSQSGGGGGVLQGERCQLREKFRLPDATLGGFPLAPEPLRVCSPTFLFFIIHHSLFTIHYFRPNGHNAPQTHLNYA